MHNFDKMVKKITMNYDDEVEKVRKKETGKQIVIFRAGQMGHKVYQSF